MAEEWQIPEAGDKMAENGAAQRSDTDTPENGTAQRSDTEASENGTAQRSDIDTPEDGTAQRSDGEPQGSGTLPGTDGERTISIEEALTELEAIIEKMEDRDSSLEDTFALYECGMKLVKDINGRIDKVEKKIRILAEEGQDDE